MDFDWKICTISLIPNEEVKSLIDLFFEFWDEYRKVVKYNFTKVWVEPFSYQIRFEIKPKLNLRPFIAYKNLIILKNT